MTDLSASPKRTPTNNPLEDSKNSSRAPSPALEATETEVNLLPVSAPHVAISSTTLSTDENPHMVKTESISIDANRRKSSTWKAFNIKKQLIKVDSRLRNTFVTATSPEPVAPKAGSTFYTATAEDNVAECLTSAPTFAHNDRNEYLEEIESEIVKSLKSQLNTDSSVALTNSSEQETQGIHEELTETSILQEGPAKTETGQKVSFAKSSDEPGPSRPADLPLATSPGEPPVAPPRISKLKNTKQRLLSVPNIKYSRQQQQPPADFSLRGKMSVGHKDSLSNYISTGSNTASGSGTAGNNNAGSSSFANSFMRRFSKYQLENIPTTQRCFQGHLERGSHCYRML